MATWTWKSLRSGHRWTDRLWLYGEIDMSSVVDEIHPATGEEQVAYWRDHVRGWHPEEEWKDDAVSVSWYIEGGSTFESSPDCPTMKRWQKESPEWRFPHESFSTCYTTPINVETGAPLRSWSDLPRSYRFKEFSRVYGFVPPHTAFVPVRTWTPWTAQPLDNLGPSESCQRCGRPLSDPLSVDAGHGPWCARKVLTP